ncbi:MAG: peptidylprolyl isomerase [bacterium]|nr:peptidylprolyl isomerase [bacterium]
MEKYNYFLTSIICIILLAVSSSAELVDRVVAKVGSEAIFLSDLDKAVQAYKLMANPPTPEEILQQLIDRALLIQEAKRLKITPSELAVKTETKRQLAQIRTAFKSEIEFQLALEKEGLTIALLEEQFSRRAKEELMVRILLRKKMKLITDEQVAQFIAENPEPAKQINRVRLRHIFFALDTNAPEAERTAILTKANLALSKLKSGEKWEDVLKEYSDDAATKPDAGDLGFIAHGDSLPEIESVAFELPVGKISDLLQSEQGYHIIQVMDRSSVKQYLEMEAVKSTRAELINQLRDSTKIEIKF